MKKNVAVSETKGVTAINHHIRAVSITQRMPPEETQDEKTQDTGWLQLAEVHIKGMISMSPWLLYFAMNIKVLSS